MKIALIVDGEEVYRSAPSLGFAVGDWVRTTVAARTGLPRKGAIGRVVYVGEDYVAVEFAVPFTDGHGCSGSSKDGRGRDFFTSGYHEVSDCEHIDQLELIE